ncbi:transcriptional regulator, TetR family protein [Methyloglobulus morosus KoM1]|uniref:Transcriptional regulator, TetR family protein n=1 Tax=Methyloglobulus morosus KoM1 TaxID=1116472 RepID=V5B0Q2_9GAMM|nr:TetR/AcrR family transcriptional regulator [Methyloglobulus morosus]ESS66725.1 transcriptional regulator, TetR family protein [Methyloglobulus morosus KoM1]
MARPISFDRDQVLKEAIQLFWSKGYQATSMKNLEDATGLKPGSLYLAFGDKRGLFLAALDAYFDTMKAAMFSVLHDDGSPNKRLESFFYQLVQESCSDPNRKGCMLINTLSETPAHDAEINLRLQQMFTEIELALKGVLVECQVLGQLNTHQRPESLAKFLMTGIFGLRLFNKTQPNSDTLKVIVDNLLFVAFFKN